MSGFVVLSAEEEILSIVEEKKHWQAMEDVIVQVYHKLQLMLGATINTVLVRCTVIIKKNCSLSMIKIHNRFKSSVMASMNVKKKNVSKTFKKTFKITINALKKR